MCKKEEMVQVVTKLGYIKKGYGFKKKTKHATHWVSIFDDSFQAYSYLTDDEELEKIYDSGHCKKESDKKMKNLLKTLVKNHK